MPSPGSKTIVAFIACSLSCSSYQPEPVLDAIDERDERRLDDAGRRADGGPSLAPVAMIDEHARGGRRALAPVDDANLVVLEMDRVDLGVRRGERLAQRRVERADRAV